MRVRILTPVDVTSAIATKTLAVAQEMSKYVDVDIVGEPTEFPRVTPFRVHPYPAPHNLPSPDIWMVALGNSGFHKAALRLVQTEQTIVMLHDLSLFGAASVDAGDASINGAFGRLIEEEYGAAVLARVAAAEGRRTFGFGEECRFLRRYLRNARGVITHSKFAVDVVQQATVAPVRLARLPLTDRIEIHDRVHPTLSSIGHVNDNRSIPLVLEALSLISAERRPSFRIVGPIAPEQRMRLGDMAQRLGIADSVVMTGRINESEMRDELGRAWMFVNLRNPVMEAASDSFLRQMANGAPVLVYDHGCYSEVPDGAAVKLPLTTNSQSLARQIMRLLESPAERASIGSAARAYVAQEHHVGQYVSVALELLRDVLMQQARMDMLHRLGRSMSAIGLVASDPVLDDIARAENFLFGDCESQA